MKPRIPMSPAELPQQRLVLVGDLRQRPEGFITSCNYGFADIPGVSRPSRRPNRAHFVCMLEWAWSPAHNRISAYYVHRDSTCTHWLFWMSCPSDDYFGNQRWDHHLMAYGRSKGVDLKDAAAWMLHDSLKFEMEDADSSYLDFWVDNCGVLSVSEISAVKRELRDVVISEADRPRVFAPVPSSSYPRG